MDFANMTLAELGGWAALALLAISTLVEISPIKINPWSRIAKAIGRAINGEVIAKVNDLEKHVKRMEDTADERDAKSARNRILRFGDECLHGVHHSKEHFDQILRDITEYESYCERHPEFKNNMAVLTIGNIKSNYQKCLQNHDFL